MAGHVVQTGEIEFFKDSEDKPLYFVPNGIDAKSALVVPILDGKRVIAILNMESDNPRWCGDLQIGIAQYAAQLASNLLVAYRLSMEKVQADELRRFEPIHIEEPDVKEYLKKVLEFAARLTASPDQNRWGQVALVQDGQIAYSIACKFATGGYTEKEQTPLEYAVFRQVCETQPPFKPQPYLIPNIAKSNHEEYQAQLPWPKAQSLLCVPLVDKDEEKRSVVIGLLTMASSRAYYLNEEDRAALSQFAHTVTHGLEDIARLYSRVSLTSELQPAFQVLQDRVTTQNLQRLRDSIFTIPDAENPADAARETVQQYSEIQMPLQLMGQLPQWYLTLSNFYSLPTESDPREQETSISVGKFIRDLKPLIGTFVDVQIESPVYWQYEPADQEDQINSLWLPPHAAKGKQLLLKAALFGCISMGAIATRKAGRYGHKIEITISKADAHLLSLVIEYSGRPIPDKWWIRSPRFHLDESTGMNTMEEPERRLAEVNRIIQRLGGSVGVKDLSQPDRGATGRAAIELRIPYF